MKDILHLTAACLLALLALSQASSASEPFGDLPLVDEVLCGDPADAHQFAESPERASVIRTLLDRQCRVLPNEGGPAYFAYRLGAGKGLEPGAAYLLTVDYPEDRPRTVFVLNRGCETARGFHTGATIGDVAYGYTDNALESLRIPLSGVYRRWRMFFYLHDRFPGLEAPRGAGARPHLPEEGFWVIIARPEAKDAPMSAGAAVSRIRLYRVESPESYHLDLRLPPPALPRRHIFWREEMADGVVHSLKKEERGVRDPLDWYRYKVRLMRFLGVNTFCKDLLEFGHNQGWDSGPHGGNDWVYQSRYPGRWARIVEMVGREGLSILPYYEYAGSIGRNGLGSQKRCVTLGGGRDYTQISWSEKANADVCDPDTLADARKVLEATIARHSDGARFLGAWFRTRPSHLPISFSDRCLGMFARETGLDERPTRADLRGDEALLGGYYDWWYGKRREFLIALRDYLRREADPEAVVLFTPEASEPGPPIVPHHRVVVTDDMATWGPLLKDVWGWTISARPYEKVVAEDLHLKAALAPRRDWDRWEWHHSCPPPDPARYRQTEGVLLTYPFNRCYTVSSPRGLPAFRGPSGLSILRHYSLNENEMGEMLGYFVSDMERAGPFCMLAEARAVAHGDPRYIGYLAAASFNRGFPQYVRRFNAAFLSLPALPSEVLEGACHEPDIIVRAIRTQKHGTYVAVVNTGFTRHQDLAIHLPHEGAVTNAATGKLVASAAGTVKLTLAPCELRSLNIR